jgi:hypothetical protein
VGHDKRICQSRAALDELRQLDWTFEIFVLEAKMQPMSSFIVYIVECWFFLELISLITGFEFLPIWQS